MDIIIIYIASLLLMIILDYLWLGVVARNFFRNKLGDFLAEKTNWFSAFLFYLVFISGILIFVIPLSDSLGESFLLGAFLGVIAYGTYEFTNHAFIKNWPLSVMPADIIWGAFVSGLVSLFAYNLTIWIV